MENADIERDVAAHYTQDDVAGQIIKALGLHDAAPGTVGIERLFAVDQLHHGGIGLTETMARVAAVRDGMAVLDAGSGIGGSARFLADRFGCSVQAIDLSAEFVRSAQALDRLAGLDDRIGHRAGSVTQLPYPDASFDLVWSQNVSMNVPDKHAMFSEALRVLRPGGTYVLSHIGESGLGAIPYPLPWAMQAEMSFALPPADFLNLLAEVGFGGIADHAPDNPLGPPPSAPPDDLHAMGADMPRRRANTARAMAEGTLVPMLVTARRQ